MRVAACATVAAHRRGRRAGGRAGRSACTVVWPPSRATRWSATSPSAVGLYPGDEVRVVGVPVGTIESIEPQAERRQDHHDGEGRRQGARRRQRAHHRAEPGGRQVHSAHARLHRRRRHGDGAEIGLDRTAVPVEWDEVKEQLTQLSERSDLSRVGCRARSARSSTRPPTPSTATATRSGKRCGSCRRPQAGWAIRAPTCSARSAICRCWSNALSNSNEQIVQFSDHVASVSQVLADSSRGPRQHARHPQPGAGRRQGIPQREQPGADRAGRQADRLHQHPDRPQRRHRADPARHAQRAGELLQHLQPGPGHASAVCCRCRTSPTRCSSSAAARSRRRDRPTTTSEPRSAASGWARCSSASR